MSVTKPAPKLGDPCPACGGAFRQLPAPTPEQRTAAANRENPAALPAGTDTATEEQRSELGALFVCTNCGYKTRIKPDASDAADPGSPKAGAAGADDARPPSGGTSGARSEQGGRGRSTAADRG